MSRSPAAACVWLLQVTLLVPAPVLARQAPDDDGFGWRRYALAAAGAAVLGGIASLQKDPEEVPGVQESSGCSAGPCLIAIGAAIGGGLGFLVGYELDNKVARRRREGPTLRLPMSSVGLGEGATGLQAAADGVIALTRRQVSFVDSGLGVRTLATDVQGRAAALLPERSLLLVASSNALLAFPTGTPGEGSVVSPSGAASLAGLGSGALAVGEPGRVRRLNVVGGGGSASALEEETAATEGLPAALALGAGALWTVVDSALLALDPRSLQPMGRLSLPGRAETLTVSGSTGLVSLGTEGAVVVDLRDPRAPAVAARLGGMESARGGVVVEGRAYVAAGSQGVFVFDVSAGAPELVGVLRDFGHAGDVQAAAGSVWVLDRARDRVFRIDRGDP